MARITIIGLGLLGTSLGLALKRADKRGHRITGFDTDMKVARQSKGRGAMDKVEGDLAKAVADAEVVVIATPVRAVKPVLETIASHLPQGAVVTDVASTKRQVMAWAEELLPRGVSFIGGHPMAGLEQSGPEAAKADLFAGAMWCLMPGRFASEPALKSVMTMAESVGAKTLFVDPQEHDLLVAGISHAPLALSAALVACTSRSASWPEMAGLAAGGYRDVTRLASGSPTMSVDIFLTNADAISDWLDRCIAALAEIRQHVQAQDAEQLIRLFSEAYSERERWLAGVAQERRPRIKAEVPTMMDSAYRTLFGEAMYKQTKRLFDLSNNPTLRSRPETEDDKPVTGATKPPGA